MKFLSLFTILFISANAFAGHDQLQIVQNLSRDVLRLTTQNAQSLSESELVQVTYNLRQAKKLLKGDDVRPNYPGPIDNGRPGTYGQRVCSAENTYTYQETFQRIKQFAYSSTGLNLSSQESINYALDWSTKYPCAVAETFISRFVLLKNFAYSSTGLNYSSLEAKDYALAKLHFLCPGVDIASEYRKHYEFAYSSRGLNYSSLQARDYAQPRAERVALTCPSSLVSRF